MTRPRVTVNCAASIDGKISTKSRTRVDISDARDRERVMALRRSHDAIAVGIGTVLSDDPALSVVDDDKSVPKPRIVFDSRGRTPATARILAEPGKTYVVTSEDCKKTLKNATMVRCGTPRVDIAAALELLHESGIRSLLVEGGGELIFEFARLHLIDKLTVYTAPFLIGGENAPTIADGPGFASGEQFERFRLVAADKHGEGVVAEYEKKED